MLNLGTTQENLEKVSFMVSRYVVFLPTIPQYPKQSPTRSKAIIGAVIFPLAYHQYFQYLVEYPRRVPPCACNITLIAARNRYRYVYLHAIDEKNI